MQATNDTINTLIELPNRGTVPPQHSSLGSLLAWVIWTISAVFVLFQFFIQLTSGVLVEGLMKSFSLTAFTAGLLASAYYYVYVLLQAPAGFLIDRYGTRRMLSMGAAVFGIACILFAMASHVGIAFFSRALMGVGASFAFVGSMNLVSRWFPLSRFGLMAAMAETSGMIGSLFGSYYLAHLVSSNGWRYSMRVSAIIALVIALLLVLIVRNAPKNVTPIIPQTKAELWQEIKFLVKKPVVWLNGIYSAAVFGVITIFVALWGIPFMQKAHHLSLSKATLLCNLVFVGVAAGAPLLGWLDRRVRSRQFLMVGAAVLTTLLLLLVILDQALSIMAVSGLMFLLGMATSSYVLNFVIANEISTPHTRSTSIGITNMFSVGSAPIFQPLIGLILYLFSHNTGQANLNAYTLGHFKIALLVIPLFTIIAAIIGCWLPNRKL